MADFFYTSFDVVTIDENGYRVEVIDDDVNVFNVTQNVSLGTLPTDSFGIVAEGSFNDGGFDVALNDVIEISHATYTRTARFVLKESLEAAYQASENAVATYVAENDFADEFEPEALDIYLEDKNQPGQVPVLLGTVPRGKAVALPYQTAVTKDARLYGVPVTNNFLNDLQDPTQFPFTEFLIPGTSENIGVRSFADFYTDVTTLTDESDIGGAQWEPFYDAQILPNTLNLDGDEINAVYHGVFAANTNTKELRMSFGGVTFGSVSSQQSGLGWDYRVTIMRNGASSVRWSATLIDAANAISVGEIGMLDFTGNLTLTLQGRTETADGDLTAKKGKVLFVPALPPDIFPPSVPVIKAFTTVSDTELALEWNASTDNVGVTGYEVRIRLASGSYGAPVDVGNVLDHQFTGLVAGTEYGAQPRAYDAAGNFSAWSTEASAVTDPTPLLLDTLSVMPNRAFSFRKLRGAYAGPCCKVRTSATTGAYTDIDFDVDGWVDESAMAAVGSPVFVLFYDQTGNGNHQAQLTTNAIPRVFTNQINSRPGIGTAGTARIDYGDLSGFTAGEHFILMKRDADPPSGNGLLHNMNTAGDANHIPFSDGTIYDGFGSTARKTTVNPTPSFESWRLYSAYSANADWANYLDGTQLFSTGTNTVGFPSSSPAGSIIYDSDLKLAGEHLLFAAKLGSSDRTKIFNDIETVYGLTF